MIKANELRIGNWVNDVEPYEYYFQIEWDHIARAATNEGYQYRGIPLTPEWLERMGLIEDKQHECYVIWQSESDIAVEYFDGLVHLVGHTSAQPMDHIQFAHQLQNLYFTLTGEELIIKEQAGLDKEAPSGKV